MSVSRLVQPPSPVVPCRIASSASQAPPCPASVTDGYIGSGSPNLLRSEPRPQAPHARPGALNNSHPPPTPRCHHTEHDSHKSVAAATARRTVGNGASDAVDTNRLALDVGYSPIPRSNTTVEMLTTRSAGVETRGRRVPRGMAIQTSAESCVPMESESRKQANHRLWRRGEDSQIVVLSVASCPR